jgi:hypothetical protein
VGAFAYIPYLITGDWYFLEEMQFNASTALYAPDPGYLAWGRGASWGYIPFAFQTRGQAWGLRDTSQAALMSPDGTPQKAYYTEKVNNNIAIEEGSQNVLQGAFPPANASCPGYTPGPGADKWCFGRMTIGQNLPNPLHFPNQGDPYGGGCGNGVNLVPPSDPYACNQGESPFEFGFKLNVMGHMQEMGFPIGPLNQTQFKWLLHMLQDPTFNPWLIAVYKMPVRRASTNAYFQTWSDVLLGFNTASACGTGTVNWRTIQGWTNCPGGETDSDTINPGYPHIMRAAASYLAGLGITDGLLVGSSGWNWTATNVGSQNNVGVNPQFAIIPRGVQSATPSCDLNGDGKVDVQDVQISISSSLGTSACGNGDLDGSGTCNVIDTQRVIIAALGGACRLGP